MFSKASRSGCIDSRRAVLQRGERRWPISRPNDLETKDSLMRKNDTVIFGILAGAVLAMLLVAGLSGRGMRGIGQMMGEGMMGVA
jgi:hypothetical protein